MKRGTKVGQAYVALTVDGDGINEEIVHEVEDAGPGVEKAGEDHGDRYSEGFFDRLRERLKNRKFDENGSFGTSVGKSGSRGGDDWMSNFVKHMEAGALPTLIDKIAGRSPGKIASKNFVDAFLDGAEKELGRSRSNKSSLGTAIGNLLGAGSRSNVLNFFGRSIGNIIDLTESGAGAVGRMFSAFKTGFSEAEAGALGLKKVLGGLSGAGAEGLGGLGEAFSGLIASGPGAVVAILAVVAALSVLVSVAGAVLAVLTAITGAITAGLTGGLLVLAGTLGAVTVAGGLAVAMFLSLTDAQKKALAADFHPLKAEMVGIGQTMLQQVIPAFSTWSSNLQKALYQLAPLAEPLGRAFAQAGNQLTASFSGPGFQAFTTALGIYLPSIVGNLSRALGSFLNGLAGLFAVLLPYVNRFSNYLADVALRFSNFANSAEGRNKIADFVDRALVALQSLWGAAKQIFGFIFDLLFNPATEAAGTSIFDSIARTFESFRANIARASANGDLKKFFDEGIQFGGKLWGVIQAIFAVFKSLYNSGVLRGVGILLDGVAAGLRLAATVGQPFVALMGYTLPIAFAAFTVPLQTAYALVISFLQGLKWLGAALEKLSHGRFKNPFGSGADWKQAADAWQQVGNTVSGAFAKSSAAASAAINAAAANAAVAAAAISAVNAAGAVGVSAGQTPSQQNLVNTGNTAIANTNIPKPKAVKVPKVKQYHLPKKLQNFANQVIKNHQDATNGVADALTSANTGAGQAITSAIGATSGADVGSTISSQIDSLTQSGKSIVDTAQSNLVSAAQSLKSATSKKAAKAALAQVRAAQAQLANAIAAQTRIQAAANILAQQSLVHIDIVNKIVNGEAFSNASLADLAEARSQVATLLQTANQKLTDALALRDNYATQVADSIKQFGAITQAQAQVINGVTQSLTASDITSDLQDRLAKITAFQNNLNVLRSQGLSDSAYKQLVDAGVDGGSAYAQALIDGGLGSVQQVNTLTDQIDSVATTLGTNASTSLYQAGVDAAQGLVDGLNSLAAEIESSATALGTSIANAIANALGIASPSRVLISMMDSVGDGAVVGLRNQSQKVGTASERLAAQIQVSPEVAAYASRQGQPATDPVSGNGSLFRDLIVQTPTEDPVAVAHETVNEIVGETAVSYDGWLEFNGVEIVNLSRSAQLAAAMGIDSLWTTPNDVSMIQTALAGANYGDVTQAPWYVAGYAPSAEFAGVISLGVQGLDDSSRSASPIEFTGDGGQAGQSRNATLPLVANVGLVGTTDRGVEYGLRWLKQTLRNTGTSTFCTGANLRYLRYEASDAPVAHRRNVSLTRAPSVTRKRSGDCSVAWMATFTLTANDPYEYSAPSPVLAGLGGSVPTGPSVLSYGTLSLTYQSCPQYDYSPVYNPAAPALVAPPAVPDFYPADWAATYGMTFQRWWARVTPLAPASMPVVPTVTLTTSVDSNMVQVSFWPAASTSDDQCDPLFSAMVTYLPAGKTLYIDGEQKACYLWDGVSPSVRRADSLVYSSDGRPIDWAAFTDLTNFLITIDLFADSDGIEGNGTVRAGVALTLKSD